MNTFHSNDTGTFILRLSVAVLMLFHGIAKLQNGIGWITGMVGVFGYGAYVAEIVAPILLIVGLWTRLAGLVIAFDMLMAIILAFGGRAFTIKEIGGGLAVELELLFLAGGLALFFLGSGRFALSKGQGRWD
jgi:putative oxidoreductase